MIHSVMAMSFMLQCVTVAVYTDCIHFSQATIGEILQRKEALRKVEDLGAQVEEALIFDNKSEKTLHNLHTHTHTHTHFVS